MMERAQKFGPVKDVIYITANLTAPADLQVTTGEQTRVLHLPAGSTDAETPFVPGGPPKFALIRGGRTVAAGAGTDPIEVKPRYNNFYYSSGVISAR